MKDHIEYCAVNKKDIVIRTFGTDLVAAQKYAGGFMWSSVRIVKKTVSYKEITND